VPKIGYVQGMNTITSVFLGAKLKDSEVYWLMKYILNKKKFEEILMDGFPRVQILNYQLDIYVRNYIPELIEFLGSKDLNVGYFSTQWFITMFSYDLEYNLLLKIWNFFFVKGWKIMIRIALSLLWHFKDKIIKQTTDELPDFLKNCVREYMSEVPEEELFRVAFSFKVSNRLLKGLETLYKHSAPTKVMLTPNEDNRLEWKIVTETVSIQENLQKDIIEYLNENIDQMKNVNKLRGDSNNELDNYRCIQAELNGSSLVVDKSLNSTRTLKNQSHLNVSVELKPTSKLNTSKIQSEKSPPNTFLQTLSDFGKKITQIWTPKDESLNASQTEKFISDKILSDQNDKSSLNKGGQLLLSSRNSLNKSTSFNRNDLKTTNNNTNERTESRHSKKSLANVLVDSSQSNLLGSIQPFSASILKEEDHFTDYEGKTADLNTSELFEKVEKDILFAPKREIPKHRKNSSLNYDMMRNFKSVLVDEYKQCDRLESSIAIDRDIHELGRLTEKHHNEPVRPRIVERHGHNWDVTGSKIKLPRDNRDTKYSLKRPNEGKREFVYLDAVGRYSHASSNTNDMNK